MITNVASAVLYVGDQEKALAFYRDVLGFDVAATVAELRSKGATVSDPISEPWGTYATVDAPDGHQVQFHERSGG